MISIKILVVLILLFICFISAALGYGFRIILDLGFVYFAIQTIIKFIANETISDDLILITCAFTLSYALAWGIGKLAEADKCVVEQQLKVEQEKEQWKTE